MPYHSKIRNRKIAAGNRQEKEKKGKKKNQKTANVKSAWSSPIGTQVISHLMDADAAPPHTSILHAGTALPHVPASCTQAQCHCISLLQAGTAPPHLLPHGSRRYIAALPPSRCS